MEVSHIIAPVYGNAGHGCRYTGSHIQHMQKTLQQMNLLLDD